MVRIYEGIMGVRPFSHLDPYFEAGDDGRVYGEVTTALGGDAATAERVDEANKLVLSVAVPIQRFKAIYGVLLVSTEGGDIDGILREERATLIQVFLVAVAVMVISSMFLARFIAEPIQRLARAADAVRGGHAGRSTIPTMEERRDEIGELAASFSAMTRALYDRIDAIERFAADVAHELKNPLTSLKSAVEMLARADTDDQRARLMGIVRNDVKRIDRLITDISDASRLDAELSRETSEPVDLAHLLETIIEVYRFTEISKGIDVVLSVELPAQARVLGRDERLGQVFRNLIDNAVSFQQERWQGRGDGEGRERHGARAGGRRRAGLFRPTIWRRSSSASTPSGRPRTSATIPGSGFPSHGRSRRPPAGASGRRTATAAARVSSSNSRWRAHERERQRPCHLRADRTRRRAAAGQERRGQVRPGASIDRTRCQAGRG